MPINKQTDLDSAGSTAFITKDEVFVARAAVATGGEDGPTVYIPGSHEVTAFWDDFYGDTLEAAWNYVEGDTGNTTGSIQNFTNGVVRLTVSATSGTSPSSGLGLNHGNVQWKANQGRLRFITRVKMPTVSSFNLFAGLTDSTAAEMPAYDTGAELITTAADCIGFLYSSQGSTTRWRAVAARGVAGDSGDPTPVTASSGPTANRFDVLELKVDGGNLATFWLNGRQVGSIPNPVDPIRALTPVVYGFVMDTGASNTIDIDYIGVSALRDTGT
jgi:hypothetical protein